MAQTFVCVCSPYLDVPDVDVPNKLHQWVVRPKFEHELVPDQKIVIEIVVVVLLGHIERIAIVGVVGVVDEVVVSVVVVESEILG